MVPYANELRMRAFATLAIRTVRELRRVHPSCSVARGVHPSTLSCTEVKVVAHVLVNVYAIPWAVVNSYFGPIPTSGGLVDRKAAELCRQMCTS